ICPGTYEGPIAIGKDLTLVGAGADATLLTQSDNNAMVVVRANSVVAIQGVTITGGTGRQNFSLEREGGGIFNAGILTLTDVAVVGNQANVGAGIFNEGEARLTINASVIRQNEAVRPESGGSEGGGIVNRPGARLTIANGSVITQNTADN